MRVLASIALVVLATGCKSSGCAESSSATEPPDAAVPVVAEKTKTDAAAADPLVNLLYTTPAVVAVSSKVDNPKDFPEHLIDGKPETAWNSKTGDLVGGFIAFRVPADAHVTKLAMSAGFDKRTATGEDLFSSNHRIARVRVSRNGAALKEIALDLGKRGPQDLKVDAPGGDFRIEVLEVAPGTRPEWRELTVSELAVWGTRGATRLAEPHLPEVRIGSLDAVDAGPPPANAHAMNGPIAQLASFCATHEAEWKPRFARDKDDYPGFIEGPYCSIAKEALLTEPAPARLLEVRAVSVTTHDTKDDRLALRTRRGWFVTSVVVATEELRNPGCGGGCELQPPEVRFSASGKDTPLVVTQIEECWSNPWPDEEDRYPGSRTFKRTASVCRVADDGTPACVRFDIGHAERPYNDKLDGKWTDEKKEKVLPSGELVFQ